MNGKPWTTKETEFLKERYYLEGCKRCAIALNRTVVAVERKVRKFGLHHVSKNKTTESYIEELLLKGIDIAPIQDYKGSHTSITHEHLACGCKWQAKPTNILSGKGCPACKNGISPNLPTILYCAKAVFGNITFYKLGITNRSFDKRYSARERLHLTLIWEVKYATGSEAYAQEQKMLEELQDYKVNYGLLTSGNTECVSIAPIKP